MMELTDCVHGLLWLLIIINGKIHDVDDVMMTGHSQKIIMHYTHTIKQLSSSFSEKEYEICACESVSIFIIVSILTYFGSPTRPHVDETS